MQIIQEQRIAFTKVFTESAQLAQTHRLHETIGEVLRRGVTDAPVGLRFAQAGVDAFEEMRFARADRSMPYEWIDPLPWRIKDA